MLNEGDIVLMDDWRDEIMTLRERPIIVIYLDKVYDDFTGEFIGESDEARTVNAVVTELSINKANGSRYIDGGIEYEQGDIKVDISIALITDIADKVSRIEYDGKDYEILGADKKGIGPRNRYEMIGRVMA